MKWKDPNQTGWIALDLQRLSNQMWKGCGNHGCVLNPPKGMATNGPCQCAPDKIIRELLDIAERIERESK